MLQNTKQITIFAFVGFNVRVENLDGLKRTLRSSDKTDIAIYNKVFLRGYHVDAPRVIIAINSENNLIFRNLNVRNAPRGDCVLKFQAFSHEGNQGL